MTNFRVEANAFLVESVDERQSTRVSMHKAAHCFAQTLIEFACRVLVGTSQVCYTKHSLSLTFTDRGDLGQLAPRKKLLKSCWDFPSFHPEPRAL